MLSVTSSLSRTPLPSAVSVQAESSTVNTTMLLQGLMESWGWQDQRAGIYAAEAQQQFMDQQLRLSFEHYLVEQNARNKVQLIAALQEALAMTQAETAYALKQQAYYQVQREHEAKAIPSLSYAGQWSQWALQGVKRFFGSTTEQLVEKYTTVASKRQVMNTQLRQCLVALHADKTVETLSETQEGDEAYLIDTELAHTGQRRLLSTSTPFQFPAVIPLASLNGQYGFKLEGEASHDKSGTSVSTAGDINGDGYTDLLIGTPYSSNIDCSYVVFGGPGIGQSGLVLLSSLNGSNGFKLNGETTLDQSGFSVSAPWQGTCSNNFSKPCA